MIQNEKKISLLSSLWKYFKKPDYNLKPISASFSAKLADVLKYWSLGIIIAFFAGILSAMILNQAGIDDSQNVLQNFFIENSIFFIILLVFFWGPITEEFTFRLALRYSPYNFGFFLSFICFLFFEVLIAINNNLNELIEDLILYLGTFYFFLAIVFLLIFNGFLFGWIIINSKLSKQIESFYNKNFSFIFYFFIIAFASLHIFNYTNFNELWLALPFLVAPQLFLGFILSYIRIRYGFVWSIFYHIFHNSLVSLPLLFFSQISNDSLEAIINKADNVALNIPISDLIYIFVGSIMSFFIFLLIVISFYFLIKDYKKYKNITN